jgi:hypothetical protein
MAESIKSATTKVELSASNRLSQYWHPKDGSTLYATIQFVVWFAVKAYLLPYALNE